MPLETHYVTEPDTSADDIRTAADDRALAGRIRVGDIAAFEALYRTYWQRLYTFAFRYVHSKEDAEEVVQEVFFRIWRGRAHWAPAGAVRNYLYLAVRNAARDRLERAVVARRWRLGQVATVTEIQSDLDAADLIAAVERALAELPSKRSAVCRLRLIDDLSYAQIADRLGICQKTVETQLARGLKFVRGRIRRAVAVAHPGLAPGVRTSAPADGSAVNTYRATSPAAPRGA
jgi:RNA polymerase sigma-70 factor, ECF subfamily